MRRRSLGLLLLTLALPGAWPAQAPGPTGPGGVWGTWQGESGSLVVISPQGSDLALSFSWNPAVLAVQGLELEGRKALRLRIVPQGASAWTGLIEVSPRTVGGGQKARVIDVSLGASADGSLRLKLAPRSPSPLGRKDPETLVLLPAAKPGTQAKEGKEGLPTGNYVLQERGLGVTLAPKGEWLEVRALAGDLEEILGALGLPRLVLAPTASAGRWKGSFLDPQGRSYGVEASLEGSSLSLRIGTWPLSITRVFSRP